MAALVAAGVINTPDYWLANYDTFPSLDLLAAPSREGNQAAKEELDEWLLQNHELAVDDATRMAHEAAAVQPFLNEKRHGKRKKN